MRYQNQNFAAKAAHLTLTPAPSCAREGNAFVRLDRETS